MSSLQAKVEADKVLALIGKKTVGPVEFGRPVPQ
jgi:hypothetical protein